MKRKSFRGKLKNASPAIFAALSIVGLTATVIAAFKEAPEAKEALEVAREEKQRQIATEEDRNVAVELTFFEKAKTVAPHVKKTAMAAAVTFATIVFSHKSHLKKEALLAGALGVSQRKHLRFLKEASDKYGSEDVMELKKRAAITPAASVRPEKGKGLKKFPKDAIFAVYVEEVGVMFETCEEAMIAADANVTKRLRERRVGGACASLNDWITSAGGRWTEEGDMLLWDIDNRYQNEFWSINNPDGILGKPIVRSEIATKTVGGKPCNVVAFNIEPMEMSDEDLLYYDHGPCFDKR